MCANLDDPARLQVDCVLDAQVQITEALARCPDSQQGYLLELLDIRGADWVYRISLVEAEAYAKTVKSLTKGSCDINRARNEVFSLSSHATQTRELLWAQNGTFTHTSELPEDIPLPTQGWRDLPCDGSLIKQLA